MKRSTTASVLLGAIALVGCDRATDGATDLKSGHGRYSGVGIYSPSPRWAKLADNQHASDPNAARPLDDQAIIVVQDTMTGEVRACGDLTGYCVGMNPWKSALTSARTAPVAMTEHAAPDAEAASDKPAEPVGAAPK